MHSQGQVSTTAALNKIAVTVSDHLEIFSPVDVSVMKFLGSGGYGEVYLGKWHSSEAAIKCLNASLFYPGGDGSQVNVCGSAAVGRWMRDGLCHSGHSRPS